MMRMVIGTSGGDMAAANARLVFHGLTDHYAAVA
jgi:hypothetical protein